MVIGTSDLAARVVGAEEGDGTTARWPRWTIAASDSIGTDAEDVTCAAARRSVRMYEPRGEDRVTHLDHTVR